MNRIVRATATALVLVASQLALAQPGAPPAPEPANLRGDSVQTRKRLAEAEQKITSGKAADAADDLQRLLDESADDLVTLDGHEYRSARWVAHALLAKLPPDALKTYRDRIDQPAQKLLDEAKRTRDPHPLWLLLDRYFVSRPADEALRLLGDLLFERGEFRAAEGAWRRLLPDAGADVVYPGSKADPALVRARIALAAIFQSDLKRARVEIDALKAKHPTAVGPLAGKTGPLVDTLEAYLDAPPKLPPDATGGTAWPTYGGGPDRAGRVPGGLPRFARAARASWYSKDIEDQNAGRPGSNFPPGRPPFGHPVVVGDEVFVADGGRVLGFDLRTGTATRRWTAPVTAPNGPDAVCTLTATGGRLYARSGPAIVRAAGANGERPSARSALVCLDLEPGKELKEVWRVPPPEDGKVTAWEGAPLVSGRRLWAVYARFEGGRTVHVAVCYDPADNTHPPGRPTWQAELCDYPAPISGGERTRQELLTLAGRHVVFCSNNGAVVALDAVTGRRAWGFRYPRALKAANGATGDPAPAVAFDGRVFVAPVDGGHVYALDAETGRLAWQSGPTEGARILGVARGRLIIAVTGPVRSVRGLNLANGSYHTADGGWVQPTTLLSYGQGLVADNVIVWPSREGLHYLNPENGRSFGDPVIGLSGGSTSPYFGNLAYADGVLVVVTPRQVRGYVAESRKVVPLPDAPRERFDALISRAERAIAAGQSDRARGLLAEAATGDLPAPLRAWAAARMLQLCPTGTGPERLPAEVREALRPPLLTEWVIGPDGIPVTLGAFVSHHAGKPLPTVTTVRATDDAKPCAPDLGADAGADHVLRLPHAVNPLRLIAGAVAPPKHLFAAGPRVVIAVPIDRSAARECEPAEGFTHAADLPAGFVAAGPFAVAVYGAAREPVWVFRVPTTTRLPAGTASDYSTRADEPPVPYLSSFALAGSCLIARIGEYHLVALDLVAQRVVWVLGANGRAGYEPIQFPGAARFGPHFATSGPYAVVQLSDGRRWFVRLDSGRPVILPALGELTARSWWASAPACAGPDRLLIPDGPGLVRLAQLGGRVKWAYETDRDDGLSGEPPQARVWGDVLLVAVRRNTGVEIERLGTADGKRVWSDDPAFADADRIDLRAADTDADRVYVPAANKLLALALGTGKTVWEADLPDDRGTRGWVVRAGKTCVIAYPVEALPAEPPSVVWKRLVRSFRAEPFVWRLPGLATTLYDAWVDRAVPVLLFDPESGKKIARIDIPARGPSVSAWFDADTAVVATGDRVVWLK